MSKKTAIALMAGVAAGTLLGILIAPASGRDTRRRLRKGMVSAKDTTEYRWLQLKDLVDEFRRKKQQDQATNTEEPAANGAVNVA